MAISYEDWKSQYEGMTTDQQKNYANMVKGNALAEEYANRYIQESKDAGTFGTRTAKSYTNANQNVNTPTQNTPVNTPTRTETPTTTPTPTTRQETSTVIGETNTEKPKAETVVSTVSDVKQEGSLTPLSKEYYSQTSEDAQTKIINNLNTYKASNPEYFTDYETFKRNFSYNARNDEQKNTLDTWYKGYSQGLQLSSTPVADLYTQYKNGSISTGDLESLRVQNPGKYAELQAQINKGNIIAAYDDDNTTSTTMIDQLKNAYLQSMITNLNTAGSGAGSVFDDYQAKMESPEMLGLGDEAAAKQEEIEKVQADIDSMTKQVEAEYEGTGASRAKINAIVADRTYDLQLQLRSLNSEYNRVATQYNNRMNQYQNEFQLQLQEYQINMQERNQKMNELGFAMDLMSYETPQQQQEREWNYWVKQQEYTNGDINSKDYSTRYKAALKSVQNLLSQYPGIPMKRSAEQMAEDIIKNIDSNGTTLGQELSTINDFIKQKPEYKQLYNNTYGAASGISKTYNIGGKEYVEYNGELMTSEDFNKRFGGKGQAKAYNQVDEGAFSTSMMSTAGGYDGNTLGLFLSGSKYQDGKYFGECGKFVNDYLQFIGVTDAKNRYYDNDLSTKLNSVNAYTPKVGSIAVFDYNHKSSDGINHGHVGIVTNVYDDGSFDVIDANFGSDGKIQIRNVKAGQAATKGFFDPSIPSTTSNLGNNAGSGVEGSIAGVPLTFERSVKNLVPAALQNSDAEREALNTVITNAYKGGADEIEVALQFMGFNIRNAEDENFALSLVDTIRTLPEIPEGTIKNVSDLINRGQKTKAIQLTENLISKQAQQANNYISETSVKNAITRSNELSAFMEGLSKKPNGVVQGTMQEWLGKLSSSDSKKLANYIAQLETSLDIKDKDLANRIVPQLSDQPSVFASKLELLNSRLMQELNGWRDIYGLPALTTDALNNFSNRVSLYTNTSGGSSSTIGIGMDNAVGNLKKYELKQ